MTLIRLKIHESPEAGGTEITVTCREVDDRLQDIIRKIEQLLVSFTGRKDGIVHTLEAESVLYIEAVDNTVFLYTAEDVYESGRKLYEYEEQLAHTAFLRISKNQIVNTAKTMSVRALLNGRFEAKLANGEKTIVNRHYAKAFRNHFLG
ncbi:LytTR family DNA-binding domain-containing protein [Sporosarcina trichiuri]|uniref:LytTR family DNA-binding domain-containing protein n=1 Tax=Sporosarcina trichiuri TaxID=3056445 RepID=UPI0025B41ADD|nr:LytTR family DNA-binding domain-containing protein [Sporosarcina sp. 0.2-SM1T-5]WJY26095.1 LytTR family DNA-binding domain-containing protein [Sporosarcina sp. 0.2-SM1T-5]